MTYNVFGGTLNLTLSISILTFCCGVFSSVSEVSERVNNFFTADQDILGYLVPYNVAADNKIVYKSGKRVNCSQSC